MTRAMAIVLMYAAPWACELEAQATLTRPIQIGGTAAADSGLFASVRDVALSRNGRLYVLDDKAREVIVFDTAGRVLGKAGRRGNGPGEFQTPVAIEIVGDTMLMVLDASIRRVTAFSMRSTLPSYIWDAQLLQGASDFCAIEDRLYFRATSDDGRPIQEYRFGWRRLDRVRGLGAADYRHPLANEPLFAAPFASGSVACDPVTREVVWSSSYLGEVRWISTGAEPRQRTLVLPGFSRTAFRAIDVNSIGMEFPDAGRIDRILSTVFIDDQIVEITVGARMRGEKEPNSFAFYEHSILNGDRVRTQGARAGSILKAVAGNLFACYTSSSIPSVWLYRRVGGQTPACVVR